MKNTQFKSLLFRQQAHLSFSQNRMLKICLNFSLSVLIYFIVNSACLAQSVGDYQSHENGPWNQRQTWEYFDGVSWAQPSASQGVPNSTAGNISIRAGHIVVISNAASPSDVDQLTIESGGQLTVESPRTLNIVNGTGDDVIVNGTLLNQGTISTISGVTIVFNDGSTYEHDRNGGSIPQSTWGIKSNCILSGFTELIPGGLNQTFGNLIVNSTGIATSLPFGNAEMMLQGGLEIRNTGTGSLIFNQDKLTIGTDLLLSGGSLTLGSNDVDRTFEVGADFSMSAGSFNISDGTAGGILNVAGNFIHTAGTITHPVGTSTSSAINFNGNALQTFTGGGAFSGPIDFNILAGATLTFGVVDFVDLSGSTGDFTNFGTLMGSFPDFDPEDVDLEGIVLAEGKTLNNQGNLAPGNSVGTLVIIGDLISNGNLTMEIEALTVYDHIIVTGTATINGTLTGEFGSYAPVINNTFKLVSAGAYNGTLTVNPPTLNGDNTVEGTWDDASGTLIITDVTLPINLLSFTGERVHEGIQLHWRTATEQNNDYMAIERAGPDFQFTEIGRVNGVGTTTEPQDYDFLDEAPLAGVNYYRLRQVDIDGTMEYHPVIPVDFVETSRADALRAFPNPASEYIRAAWQAGNDQPATLRLFTTSGQLLQTYRVNGQNGTHELPVEGLAPGIYHLQLEQGGQFEHFRFVKK